MDMDIISDIYDIKIKIKIFFSNICLRGEHIVSLNSTTFFKLVIPRDCVDLYRASHSACTSGDFEKCGVFSRQIMLASQENFRVENSCIFFLARNVKNNVHVHSFDPCAMLETNST